MDADASRPPRLSWRRRCWPIAPGLLLGSGLAGGLIDPWDASLPTLLLTTALPLLLAIVWTAVVVGGRRGMVTGVLLTGLAAYWAWWFGWGLDDNISAFSVDLAVTGLADGALYVLELLSLLWPVVLVLAIVVAVVQRRRRRGVWASLGVMSLVLVVLSFPIRASWNDGCNGLTGASPLITYVVAEPLMDLGVGVIPGGFQTLVLCSDTGDKEWKPFWLGGDGLPPKPGLGTFVPYPFGYDFPKTLYRPPAPLPGRAFEHVAIAYTESDRLLVALMVTSRLLPERLPGERLDVRADGVGSASSPGLVNVGREGKCYTALWRQQPGLPPEDRGNRVRITYESRGRLLAEGSARVVRYATPDDKQPFFRQFGC